MGSTEGSSLRVAFRHGIRVVYATIDDARRGRRRRFDSRRLERRLNIIALGLAALPRQRA
jgi:hypothetical protein